MLEALTGSRLVKVYSTVTVPPGVTGSSVKLFVKLIKLFSMTKLSVAGSRTLNPPFIVAVKTEVVLL